MRGASCSYVLAFLATGCGIGIRTGTSVSRTKSPVTLTDQLDDTNTNTKTADGSLSSTWMDLELMLDYSYFRVSSELGGGQGGARYRFMNGGLAHPIDGPKYDWFTARSGVGAAVTTRALLDPVRLVAYGFYNRPFGAEDNEVSSTMEYGLRVELFAHDNNRSAVFDIGIAMIKERGTFDTLDAADATTEYRGDFQTTGYLLTFGAHMSTVSFEDGVGELP